MNKRIRELLKQASKLANTDDNKDFDRNFDMIVAEKFAELILANADELKRMTNTDPINKPFELDPKFVAKCDEIGRSRRQFQ
jgi:hypothetical protein